MSARNVDLRSCDDCRSCELSCSFHHTGRFQPSVASIEVDPYVGAPETRKMACLGCPVHRSHFFEVKDGPHAGLKAEGFEANAALDFGVNLDIDYASFLLKVQELCCEHGLDFDSAGCTIAWAFECYQRGLLTPADTDGLRLEWGDYHVVEALIEKMTRRDGFGGLLAMGALDASRELGRSSEAYVAHIKGQDLFEALRGTYGWTLGTAVATRGGGHLDGAPGVEFGGYSTEDCERLFGVPTAADRHEYRGKAKVVDFYEQLKGLVDALGICYFTTVWQAPDLLSFPQLTDLYNAAAGEHRSEADLRHLGDRVHNLGKAYNALHADYVRADDIPPARFFAEAVASEPPVDAILKRDEWAATLDEYYQTKGWDAASGWQTRASLEALGLRDVADDLGQAGLLASA